MLELSPHDCRLIDNLPCNRERIRMIRSISRLSWFGLLGVVWLGAIGEGQAWERPPIKVNTKFEFRVDVKVGPVIQPPTAPWYSYFPADPRLMTSMQATPFPPWPMPYPPSNPMKDAPKRSDASGLPSGPMLTQQWPNY